MQIGRVSDGQRRPVLHVVYFNPFAAPSLWLFWAEKCLCMRTHTYSRTHAYMRAHIHARMHTHTLMHGHMHTHTHTHARTLAHTHTHTHTHMNTHTYKHTLTHTHTHTHKWNKQQQQHEKTKWYLWLSRVLQSKASPCQGTQLSHWVTALCKCTQLFPFSSCRPGI